MRGISEERIIEKLRESYKSTELIYESECLNNLFKNECRELQESWIPIDEFLKSGFVGLCFILIDGVVEEAKFYGHKFAVTQPYGTIKSVDKYQATKVVPIHKPEPPKL